MSVWLRMSWTDENFIWDPEMYEGLGEIQVPSQDIWKPDITIVNSVDDTKSAMNLFSDTPAKVYPNGTVYWLTSSLCKFSCKINVENFPFDEQQCTLVLSPWTSDIRFVNLTSSEPEGNSGPFLGHGVWDLIGIPLERAEVLYPCCPDPYVEMRYTIVLRRRPHFYIYNQLFPCIPLMLISILVFCLPSESGERASLAVTLLHAMTVCLNFISENMPPTSEVVPLLGQFFGAAIVLLSMCTAITVFILNIHYRGESGKPPPHWLSIFALKWLGHYLFINPLPEHKRTDDEETKEMIEGVERNGTVHRSSFRSIQSMEKNDELRGNTMTDELTARMQQIQEVITSLHNEIATKNKETEQDENIKNEWKLIAMTFDRLLLILFSISVISVNISLFTKVAYIPYFGLF